MHDGDPVVAGGVRLERGFECLGLAARLEHGRRIGLGDGHLDVRHGDQQRLRFKRNGVGVVEVQGSLVGDRADHEPRPKLADRGKAARQHQMLERGLAPPRQAIAAEDDAALEARAARRLVEAVAGARRQIAHRHHEVEPAALEPGAIGIGGVDSGGNIDPGYVGATAGYGELVHHDRAATGGRRLGAGGDSLLIAAADNAVAFLTVRVEANLAPFDAAIERHHQTFAGLGRNQWQKSQTGDAKKAGN